MGTGRVLALVVGLGLLAGAGIVALTGGPPIGATVLALVGAAALSGFVRAGRTRT